MFASLTNSDDERFGEAAQRAALQLPPRRALQKDFKKRTISRAEGGQLQAHVSWQLAPAINQVVFFDSGAIVVSYRSLWLAGML
jgi:hypothetical protein